MTFRCDLGYVGEGNNGCHIFLVVVRNNINIFFQPRDPNNKEIAVILNRNFGQLIGKYLKDSRNGITAEVFGDAAEHFKRHHLTQEELKIFHSHINFKSKITPNILAHFLETILRVQKDYADNPNFQFINYPVVHNMIRAFASFYHAFEGSPNQREFMKERLLTQSEAESLARHIQIKGGRLSKSDILELGNWKSTHPRNANELLDLMFFGSADFQNTPNPFPPGNAPKA